MARFRNEAILLASVLIIAACQTTVRPSTHDAQQAPLTLIDGPISVKGAHWAKMPTGDQIAQYYPEAAQRNNTEGDASVRCHVEPTGALRSCYVLTESPEGLGFGQATVLVFDQSKLAPGPYGPSVTIDIPMHWRLAR